LALVLAIEIGDAVAGGRDLGLQRRQLQLGHDLPGDDVVALFHLQLLQRPGGRGLDRLHGLATQQDAGAVDLDRQLAENAPDHHRQDDDPEGGERQPTGRRGDPHCGVELLGRGETLDRCLA